MVNQASSSKAVPNDSIPLNLRKKSALIAICWLIIGILQLVAEPINDLVKVHRGRFALGVIALSYAVIFVISSERGRKCQRKLIQHFWAAGALFVVFFVVLAAACIIEADIYEFQLEIALGVTCMLSCIDSAALRLVVYGLMVIAFFIHEFRNSLPANPRSITQNSILFLIYAASEYLRQPEREILVFEPCTEEILSPRKEKENMTIFHYLPQGIAVIDDKLQFTLTNRALKNWFSNYNEFVPESLLASLDEITNLRIQEDSSENLGKSRTFLQSLESNTRLFLKSKKLPFTPLSSLGKRQSNALSQTRSFAETERTRLNSEDVLSRAAVDNLKILIEYMHLRMNANIQEQVGWNEKTKEPEFLIFHGKKGEKFVEISIGYVYYENAHQILLLLGEVNEKQQMRDLQQLEKSQMSVIANVAHEFRTPLNGTMLMLEASLKDVRVPTDIKKNFIEVSLRSLQRLMFLINDLLDMSQIRAQKIKLHPKAVEIAKIVDDVSKIVALQASLKGVAFRQRIDPGVPKMIISDENRLQQILINLLGNAVKFTFSGSVELKVRINPQDPALVQFLVSDTGIGISETNQQKLFKAFEKIDAKPNLNPTGVGLGLVISNSLAQMLGTTGIEFTSKEGEGSEFFFSIPHKSAEIHTLVQLKSTTLLRAAREKTQVLIRPMTNLEIIPEYRLSSVSLSVINESVDGNAQHVYNLTRLVDYYARGYHSNIMSSEPRQATENNRQQTPELFADVLVVDDDPFCVLSLETIIKNNQYTTMAAYNGKKAVEIVSSYIDSIKRNESGVRTIKLIFIDCEMPLMNGFTASQRIKEMLRAEGVDTVPIIGCSGLSSVVDEHFWRSHGMDNYLLKPLTSGIVEEMLDEYMIHNSIEELVA